MLIFYLFFLCLLTIISEAEVCTDSTSSYNISSAAIHFVEWMNFTGASLSMDYVSVYLPVLESMPTLGVSLQNGIVALVIAVVTWVLSVGIVGFHIGVVCCCDEPTKYRKQLNWINRFVVVFSSLLVLVTAIFVVNSAYNVYQEILDPFYSVEGFLAVDVARIESVSVFLTSLFNLVQDIPAIDTQVYVDMARHYHDVSLIAEQNAQYFMEIFVLIILLFMCAIIIISTYAYITKLEKLSSIFVVIVVVTILLAGVMGTPLTLLSSLTSSLCVHNIDQTIHQTIVNNTSLDTCTKEALLHYFYCESWSSNCNPTYHINELAHQFLGMDIWDSNLALKIIKQRLLDNLVIINELSSCNFSRIVFEETKDNLCWQTTNNLIQMSLSFTLLCFQLLLMLGLKLSSFRRFRTRHPHLFIPHRERMSRKDYIVVIESFLAILSVVIFTAFHMILTNNLQQPNLITCQNKTNTSVPK